MAVDRYHSVDLLQLDQAVRTFYEDQKVLLTMYGNHNSIDMPDGVRRFEEMVEQCVREGRLADEDTSSLHYSHLAQPRRRLLANWPLAGLFDLDSIDWLLRLPIRHMLQSRKKLVTKESSRNIADAVDRVHGRTVNEGDLIMAMYLEGFEPCFCPVKSGSNKVSAHFYAKLLPEVKREARSNRSGFPSLE